MDYVDIAKELKKAKPLKKYLTKEIKKEISIELDISNSRKLDYAFHHTDNLQLVLFYLDYCKKNSLLTGKYRMRKDLQKPEIIDSVMRHIEDLLGLTEKKHYEWLRKISEGYFNRKLTNMVNFFKYYTIIENGSMVLSKFGESQLNEIIAEMKDYLYFKSTNNI